MKKNKKYIYIGITAVVVLLIALVVMRHGAEEGKAGDATVYTCSMHPQVKPDHPGTCPTWTTMV